MSWVLDTKQWTEKHSFCPQLSEEQEKQKAKTNQKDSIRSIHTLKLFNSTLHEYKCIDMYFYKNQIILPKVLYN